jgi:hypothetical protein
MTPEAIQGFVAAARNYVQRAVGVELDGSETSLAYVDHYIASQTAAAPLDDAVVALVAPALGAYLGEVAIAKFGGHWVLPDPDDASSWRVELEPAELRFYPVGMAAEALRHGEVAGFDASFSTRPEWMAPLGEALAAVPPVEEDYYYSLTGRLETLAHALDVLVELQRRSRERLGGVDDDN